MDRQTMAAPDIPPVDRSRDALAVALGNASMLGAGYLMLGRLWLALGTTLASGLLVILMATVLPYVWFEALVILWWLALIAHGWLLAGGYTHLVASRFHRLVAASVTVPLLLCVVVLRADAFVINWGFSDARRHGDCAQALKIDGRIWLGHRVADAPLMAADDNTARICWRLQEARRQLASALSSGDTADLESAYRGMERILSKAPGHERMVQVVLDPFLRGIPAKSPCVTAAITDWLGQRFESHDMLDRSTPVARRAAPAALAGCGDILLAASAFASARGRYQQVIDQYPSSPFLAKAQDGVRRATLAIELADVRGLIADTSGTGYCDYPAAYSGAPPYRKGYNRTVFLGDDTYTQHLPAGWRTTDAANATLVACAGEAEFGSAVRTCPYRDLTTGAGSYVTFYRVSVPIKAYELRTGNLVVNTKVQIGGSSCPDRLHTADLQLFVTPSASDIEDAFRPMITRT
ncbi:hypothetical protein [Fodinicola acaciae]|uniref:hypothetical protein n=1 Tax=Fodinicola acaciae TaxID=2681555 RepID=UPI0013D74BBD|nr:hypothetical protein [Fodinicola acaciae]